MFANLFEVFGIFLRLGLTSFGGPVAHLSYFHNEFVDRRKWLSDQEYADLVALCQFLPGPASSQVGMAIGLKRARVLGAIAAWIGFTLPSAIILILFGLGISRFAVAMDTAWLHSLKVVAVAVVAQALWGMGVRLCPDKERIGIAGIACVFVAAFPSAITQIAVIAFGGLMGGLFLRKTHLLPHVPVGIPISRPQGIVFLTLFAVLLMGLPSMVYFFSDSHGLRMFDSFYRVGSLVFGGGHVVLSLLQAEVVPVGWVSNDLFMAGYGAAQAIPGPLFAFAGYLGAVSNLAPHGWSGACICLIAAFLPAFLLVVGILPFWENLRRFKNIRYVMLGFNAAVVGLLAAAFYHPVWTSGITSMRDFLLAVGAFILLTFWQVPSWMVVVLGVGVGFLFL